VFDIGFQELIIIFIVALLVFGPKRLPELGRALGKALAELKRSLHDVKEQVETEFKETVDTTDIQDVVKSGSELKKSLQEVKEQVETGFKDSIDTSLGKGTETDVNKRGEKEEIKEGRDGR